MVSFVGVDGGALYLIRDGFLLKAMESITRRLGRAAVPHLLRALEDKDFGPRWILAHLLGILGPEAEGAVPLLEELLNKADENDQVILKETMRKIRGNSEEPR